MHVGPRGGLVDLAGREAPNGKATGTWARRGDPKVSCFETHLVSSQNPGSKMED